MSKSPRMNFETENKDFLVYSDIGHFQKIKNTHTYIKPVHVTGPKTFPSRQNTFTMVGHHEEISQPFYL